MAATAERPDIARQKMNAPHESCKRCGTCCLRGGPALHTEDRDLLVANHLVLAQLITVRKGEVVLWPGAATPAPTNVELVKLKGRGSDWCCFFYSKQAKECSIYAHRPLECRVFQCGAPEDLNRIIGHETLSRTDLIRSDDPVLEFILRQEMQCPANLIEDMAPRAWTESAALLRLQELVQNDLIIRSEAMGRLSIAPELELFLFGRPYFIMLNPFGFSIRETAEGIRLELITRTHSASTPESGGLHG
jgi:Fe-S-cluster containining protein